MNAIRLFAALLVLGLGGCANYPMGSLKTDLLPAEDVAASYSLNTAWWKGYHDADLDRIVALALERNVDLALSAIKVNRALYQARLLSADLVPSFSANASAAASHNIDNGNAARSYQTEFGVSYEIRKAEIEKNAASSVGTRSTCGRSSATPPTRRNGNTRPRWKTGKPHGWPSSTAWRTPISS